METLFEKLKKNKKIPMHMPGHKRNRGNFPYLKGAADIDITEIQGFDNLHNAGGILKRSMENAASMRGADGAFYLVNGSTCGILAAICAVLKRDDKVIVARNCHKSVFNGIELSGAKPVFVYPETDKTYGICGSVSPAEIEKAITENPAAKLVIVTSPTYEGVISDIEGICKIAHERDIPVLIDAAHGAHFGYGNFPKSATSLGADAAVESLHKTLPSLTQTAVCYISGKRIEEAKVQKMLAVFETSSPSYVLLSSIDGCINALKLREREIFGRWEENLDRFFADISGLQNIEIMKKSDFFGLDKSKIVLFPKTESGAALAAKLRAFGIEPEMTAPNYVICMTGAGDTRKSLKRLAKALKKIDKNKVTLKDFAPEALENAITPTSNGVPCKIADAAGKISAGYLWAYPPEVPILVPDEEITAETLRKIAEYQKNGLTLFGDIIGGEIFVVK